MKRIALVALLLGVFAPGLATAQEQYRSVLVSIKPEADIPLPPDPNLFQPGAGAAVSGSYAFPFFTPLSAGLAVNYHLGRLQHDDLGNLGSLSVISAEPTAELRLTFWRRFEAYLSGGAGYFYAFLNGAPSSAASNLVLNGRIGVGLRATPTLTIGVQGEYRRFCSLYHLIGVGLGVDLWLGGVTVLRVSNESRTD
ncbi:hypothetical protein CEE36_02515 [candidate division TA06 bacterium B3_TA06]|uniref:Outer membrane protein beta-barrel domain-containing protein n=1 Tax=candidate division TA06 bacterium B3_TA06 TaxID=2012487 RepID=A0A532V9Y0_UNCT6|nr:MAG: hypothetical protein CEE36_02515 [candidate division TA06 bacterium B3_TA06]